MPLVRWSGNKGNSGSTRIVLEGSASDPVREIRLGGEGELTDEELSRYGKRHQFDPLEESGEQEEQEEQEQEQPTVAAVASSSKNREKGGE